MTEMVMLAIVAAVAYAVGRVARHRAADKGFVSDDWVNDYRAAADKGGWTHGVPFKGKFNR